MSAHRLLAAAVTAWAAGFAALGALRHLAFETGRFDLGNMTQAVWATAHGRPLEVTSLDGLQFVRLGAHFDPVLALFAPLWWLWPSPLLLTTVQAAAVALGAVPVFRLARRRLPERAALALALAYLLSPALQWMTLSEFHPVALATPLLLFAVDALDGRRWGAAALWLALALTTKEHVGLALVPLGLWLALAHGRRRAGLVVAAAGAAVTAFAFAVVIPRFNEGLPSPFLGRYEAVGGSSAGIVRTLLTDPLVPLREAFDARGLAYLLELLLPLGVPAALAPLAAAAALPEIALNLLSRAPTQTSIHYHYSAVALAALAAAAALGLGRLRRSTQVPAAEILVLASLVATVALGPLPVWAAVPGGETLGADLTRPTAHDRVAARAVALVPPRAVVSASNSLGAHLSARRRVLSFPRVADATWIAVDETEPGYLDRIAPLPFAQAVARLRRDRGWRRVFEDDGVLVFRRVR